jgi:diacylglycerol kinase family enzyme
VNATHLLVGNPTAQSGKNAERIAEAIRLFGEAGVPVELLPSEPEGKTIAAVQRALATGTYRVVVAMGGDGTFREVAAGLYSSGVRDKVALGMLPTGTANDQGRSFGLEATDDALARNVVVICQGFETRLDTGLLALGTGAPDCFFDSAGWGISARILAQRNKDRAVVSELGPLGALYRDQAVYAGAVVRTFLASYVVDDKFDVDAVLDGRPVRLEGLSDLLIKNTRVYAGYWVFDRTSRHDDGAFELVPFRGKRDWTSKAIVDLAGNPITEEMLNEVCIEHSHPFRASRIELAFQPRAGGAALAAQVDGEEWPASPTVRIDVAPRALRLIVPRADSHP